MHDNEGQAKLDYRGNVTSRPQGLLAKTLSVVLGGVVLLSAFVVSIAFFAIAAALVLAFGVYLWWKTRDLRRQMRAQMQGAMETQAPRRADPPGDVIEGVVLSRKETSEQPRH
jgi:ABC-type nickel/cobalt efflux system permease component RcnA